MRRGLPAPGIAAPGWVALVLTALAASGCGYTRSAGSQPDPDGGLSAKEAPMLARLVKAGKLRPLAARLPRDPLVIQPIESPGYYGGAWHMLVDNPDLGMYKMIAGYAPLMRWRADCAGLEPGTATHWEYNADGTRLTIHLRRGIKWSDGVEFTSDDILYWAQLCHQGKTASVSTPFWSLVDGKEMTVTAPDQYTVVMKFAGPNWYVPLQLATGFWWCEAYDIPKHYMKQFDPNFNHAYRDYVVFGRKNLTQSNPDRPTLWPWKLARIEDSGFRMVFERNPYYYMTDDRGRQLPYIDTLIATYVPDAQVQALKIIAGEVDGEYRIPQLRDIGLYVEGRQRGGYRVLRWNDGTGANTSILLNWSPPDLVLRKLIRDHRFRQALSLAVDKQKCTEFAWRGLGVPRQATISSESWHFRTPEGRKVFRDWAASYAAFDLKRAGALLDEMGLTRRDSDGYRLRPDGKRLALLFDLPPESLSSTETDDAIIAKQGWEKLGIEVTLHNFPDAEIDLRRSTGKYEVSTHGESEMDLFTFPDWVFPTTDTYWHPLEGKWYKTGGKEGLAPTGPLKQLIDIYGQILKEKDINRAHQLVLDAIRLNTREGPFCIGTTAELPSLVIVKNNLRNVPERGPVIGPWAVAAPATTYPETYYFAPASPAARTARRPLQGRGERG